MSRRGGTAVDVDRAELPLNGPGRYRVLDGRVHTRSVEVNAVEHCNLSCRACSHASPIMDKNEMSATEVGRDLGALAPLMQVENVRIVGGEPLLHLGLGDFVESVLNAGITQSVTLVTNGLLLDRVHDSVWERVAAVEISLYPLAERTLSRVRRSAHRISALGVRVDVLEYATFREAITSNESPDPSLVRRIYDTCQIAHFWRCITVDRGWLFRCPQSLYRARTAAGRFAYDGLRLDEVEGVAGLLEFLESPEPLASCASCLGSVGASLPHTQVPRSTWLGSIGRRPEDSVDVTFLEELGTSPRASQGCMTRVRLTHN